MAIQGVPDFYPQIVDYTIDPTGTGAGGNFVAQSFTINATLPLRVDGVGSVDMSTSPRTFSANTFGTAASGIVPASGGGTTNFLRADGTWAPPAGAGGYTTIAEDGSSLTQRGLLNFIGPDITAVDNSGSSRTDVSVARFTSVSGGTVPNSGGGTSNYLRADGTWTAPGVPGGITLQGTSPGTADVGNGRISQVFIANGKLGAGKSNTLLGILSTYQDDATPAISAKCVTPGGAGFAADYIARTVRGSDAVPAALVNGDAIMTLQHETKVGAAFIKNTVLRVDVDGTPAGSQTPHMTTLSAAGSSAVASLTLRASGYAGIAQSTPLSGFDMGSSLAFKNTAKTASFTADDTTYRYNIDCQAGDVDVTLPNAATCLGRAYEFVVVAVGTHKVRIVSTVSGYANLPLLFKDPIRVYSDGTNWITPDLADGPLRIIQSSSSSAIANTAVATTFNIACDIQAKTVRNPLGGGFAFGGHGRYSTKGSGTNTIILSIRDTASAQDYAVSPTITLSNGMSNQKWRMFARWTSAVALGPGFGIIEGYVVFENTAGTDIFLPFRDPGAIINTDNAWTLAGRVQWGTADASNTITQLSIAYYLDASNS